MTRAIAGVSDLRKAVQALADASSMRAAASEIGLTYTALRWFLRGGSPQSATLERLITWQASRLSKSGPRPSDAKLAASTIGEFLGHTSSTIRTQRAHAVVDAVMVRVPPAERMSVATELAGALAGFAAESIDRTPLPPAASRKRKKKPKQSNS